MSTPSLSLLSDNRHTLDCFPAQHKFPSTDKVVDAPPLIDEVVLACERVTT